MHVGRHVDIQCLLNLSAMIDMVSLQPTSQSSSQAATS